MYNSFNLHRFGSLLKLYIAEYGKSYLIALGLCIGGMLLHMLPFLITDRYSKILFLIHITALLSITLGISLITANVFVSYHYPARGIPRIMLPASQLEKFLTLFLANIFLVVVVFVLYHALHHKLVDMANLKLITGSRQYQPIPSDVAYFTGYFYFLIQAVALLGSIYFKQNAYIKTMGIFLVLMVVAYCFNFFLAYQATGFFNNIMTFPFVFWNIFLSQRLVVEFPELINTVIQIFLIMVVVALWGIAYVRLKEKQL